VTPALLDRPTSPFVGPSARSTDAAGAVGGGRMTLEERLNSVLHEARTNGSTDCPICHAHMTREAATPSAACGDCGSHLS
jgi:ribosomal protein L37AE/L43A